jgi:hypothetical protein
MTAATYAPLGDLGGLILPRTYTPPLIVGPPGPCPCHCPLTPDTSYGFDVIDFAEAIGHPFDPWQRWAAIHIGELLPDGRPRFRKVLIMMARQNGKSEMIKILGLYFLIIARTPQILSMSNKFEYARALWSSAYKLARRSPVTADEIPVFRPGNNDPHMSTADDATWRICAANGDAGRSGSSDVIFIDELRQHHNHEAWSACVHTMNARRHAQLIAASNEGTPQSVVLDMLRDEATSGKNPRTGLFAWQAPEGARPDDPDAIRAANPNVGVRIELDDLLAEGIAAGAEGGDRLVEFLTEVLCVRVPVFKPAINTTTWAERGPRLGYDPLGVNAPIKLADHRDRLAVCIDVSLDGRHATLAGAAVVDGKTHVGIIAAWDSTAEMRRELPGIMAAVRPRALVWFPRGPAAGAMVELAAPRRARGDAGRWPPRGVQLVEIAGESAAVCMGFVEQIDSDTLRHDGHELATTHVGNAIQRPRGDLWVFDRRGAGHIDATYAMAGAVHTARSLPPPRAPLRAVRPGDRQ